MFPLQTIFKDTLTQGYPIRPPSFTHNLGDQIVVYVTQLRSGEDPELPNTLKNASYRGGRAAKCFKYSPTEGDGGVRAIRSSPG